MYDDVTISAFIVESGSNFCPSSLLQLLPRYMRSSSFTSAASLAAAEADDDAPVTESGTRCVVMIRVESHTPCSSHEQHPSQRKHLSDRVRH